jgi:hypothetical protein
MAKTFGEESALVLQCKEKVFRPMSHGASRLM